MIAESGACGLREGWDHRGEFERDPVGVEAFMVEQGSGVRVRREGSGGLGGCVFGREIQCGTPFKRNGPSAVLTRKDGAASTRGVPPSHARSVATAVTVTLGGAGARNTAGRRAAA